MKTTSNNQSAQTVANEAQTGLGFSDTQVAYQEVSAGPSLVASTSGVMISESWMFSGIFSLVVIGVLLVSRVVRQRSGIINLHHDPVESLPSTVVPFEPEPVEALHHAAMLPEQAA